MAVVYEIMEVITEDEGVEQKNIHAMFAKKHKETFNFSSHI